ncbi:MAG: FtsX-like permease family protein, partial [Ktedonobacteraceae bacterium]
MNKKADVSSQQNKRKLEIPPFVLLAWWQVRPTWRLLLVMCVGIIVAVAFVCTVPLYSDVAMTAGLRNALTSPTESADIVVSSPSEQLDTGAVGKTTQSLNTLFSKDLGSFINPAQLSIQVPDYTLMAKTKEPDGKTQYSATLNTMTLISASTNSMSPHVTVLHGRLPYTSTSVIEIALTAESAAQLHVGIGSSLVIQVTFVEKDPTEGPLLPPLFLNIPLHVVGIINPTPIDDPYWHSTTFLSSVFGVGPGTNHTSGGVPGTNYTGLTSSEGLLAYFTQFATQSNYGLYKFQAPCTLFWYYPLYASNISIYDLNGMNDAMNRASVGVIEDRNFYNSPLVEQPTVQVPGDILQRFGARTPVVAIPTTSLLLIVVGLILFFVSLISDVLIDRQSETIALLRSRGANRRQVFGVFATQSLGLGIIGLLLGPLLAVGLVWLITLFMLSPPDRSVLNLVSNHFPVMMLRLGWYPLLAALVTVCTSVIGIAQRVSSTILSMRRETARATSRTLWQRLRLDLLAVVVAVVGFVFLAYLLNSSFITTRLNLLLLTPLTLLSIFCLALAGILLFLRLYPLLLQLGSRLTMRRRGAASMLALAQMARAPRQSVRMTLLLSLATACMLFLFIFIASQSQRTADVAAYQTGADFSGALHDDSFTAIDRPQLTSQYLHVQGILSASVGYVTTAGASVSGTNQLSMQINAVDSSTFARTALWTEQDSVQPLPTLMSRFIAQRQAAIASNVIPAAVDEAMWNALQLTPGAQFTLIFNNGAVVDGNVNFVAVAEVSHIPTINDSTEASGTDDFTAAGGMMVDYQTFAHVYIHDFSTVGVAVPINYAWLKTRSDDASLQHLRHVLTDPKGCCLQLSTMFDRRAIAASLQSDPLYLDVIGLLGIGAIITIVLLLLGNLIASWLNVRSRLAQFAVLHALGATSRQVTSVLLWEQSISYITGIVLGLPFGLLLAVFLLPSLVYTGGASGGGDLSTGQFYLVQHVPP